MRSGPLVLLALLALAVPVHPQEAPPAAPAAPAPPPVLENTGKPIHLPFECTSEDIQSAGLTCSDDDPCPVYLELTGVDSVGSRIFAAGNLHTQTVTLSSTLLGSEDSGHTWREVHERIRGATLDRIQFLDPETGWTSGETLSPLPQDPFLLLTKDGGKTWSQRFVFDEAAEDHLGAIQQFAFTARDTGSLIIDRGQGSENDRYELYESPNGGESWTIRESSAKPLRLRQAATPSADWRIRADRASSSFHLEHRQGASWMGVASFLVKIGVCKP